MQCPKQWFAFLLGSALLAYACTDGHEEGSAHLSRGLYTHRLVLRDSLRINNARDMYIGQTRDIKYWKEKILISDMRNYCVWVVDESGFFVKAIGRKGRGPGEFGSAPLIIPDQHSIWFVDKSLHRVSRYTNAFEYDTQHVLPKGLYFEPNGIRASGGFVFFGGFDRVMSTRADLEALPPYVFFDSLLLTMRSFGNWDEAYYDVDKDAYPRNQKDADFAPIRGEGFFAHQRATYRIEQYNSGCRLRVQFGVPPKHWREPLKVPYEATQASVQALSEFIGSCTTYWGMSYDEASGRLFLNYANLEKDYFFQRTLLAGQHYLQVYDPNYNCILDDRIPGKMAFVKDGRIYILTEERPEYLKFQVFGLELR